MDMLWKRRAALFMLIFVFAGFLFALSSLFFRLIIPASALALFALSFLPFLGCPLSSKLPGHSFSVLRIALSALALSFLFFGAFFQYNSGRLVRQYDGQTTAITATVRETLFTTAYSSAYEAEITTESGEAFRIILETEDRGLERGDRLSATVTFSRFAEYSGTFPESRYYHSLGAVLYAEAESFTYLGQAPKTLLDRFAAFRSSLSGYLFTHLGREEGSLTAALFLGERSQLDDVLSRDFSRLGISHLLAISGMHFTVLLSAVDRILRRLLTDRRKRILLLFVADIFYMLLCGLSETVVRAGIMLLFTYLGELLGRRTDIPTSLGLASLLLCLTDPFCIYSVGFQLSVTAVLGICVFDHLQVIFQKADTPVKKSSFLREAFGTLLLSFVIQIALLPLTCLYFGETSLLAPLATVLFSPLFDGLLLLTPLYLLLSFLTPVGTLVALGIQGLTWAISTFSASLSSLRGITLSLAYPFAPFFCFALSAAVFVIPLFRRKNTLRRHLTISTAVLLAFLVSVAVFDAVTAKDVKVLSVQAEKNDALVLLSGKDVLLIDVSDGSYGALSNAYGSAAGAGATEIEGLFLTHLHARHTTSVKRLAETAYIRSLLLPAPITETETAVFRSLSDFCKKEDVPLYVYETTDTVRWGDNIEIFPLFREYLSRSTHPVIAFSVHANGTVVTYLGTSFTETDSAVDIQNTDILILGGHGPVDKQEVCLPLTNRLSAAVCRQSGVLYEATLSQLEAAGILYRDGLVLSFTLQPQ